MPGITDEDLNEPSIKTAEEMKKVNSDRDRLRQLMRESQQLPDLLTERNVLTGQVRHLTDALRPILPTIEMIWNMLDTYADWDKSQGLGVRSGFVREIADQLDGQMKAARRTLAEIVEGETEDAPIVREDDPVVETKK